MKYLIVLAGLLTGINAAFADDELRYNQVRLQSQQTEAVSNDTMHVSMNTYAEMQDPAKLAAKINNDMEWALQQAKQVQGVKINTGSYQTWPITRKEVTTGWRGQQDLVLESADTEILSRLVGQLQGRLQIKSMNFTVSDEKRAAVENRLIDVALDAFKQRAGIIGDNLKADGFRIVEINVNTSTQRPPMLRQARMASMSMEASDAVAVEGGESDVSVTVNGTIELRIP
ncbi:MAG: SIMPL domain-containing protein [Gammaproteobacteria bacterium]|jgi:predicted secreted protein|nr:SIMPL domain-containing protein [Gammaproteobacteria bacterium]MDH3887174.1 SIMPL domain-containing protein [Gammaproteobacteria bacterium]MDH3934007.1 SIMPL domain-containing protein [Gammaproteobacteria bacterium]MDH3971448.1 SIMPL domain-containing protein [Gammaproteobacteria bacterium]MDH3985317.1 SIMPL domain-containing protein [Gammaproteobacteria bacterium]